jgi:hypothetical protein
VLANEAHHPKETEQLLIAFHSTLRELTVEERRQRLAKLAFENSVQAGENRSLMDNPT